MGDSLPSSLPSSRLSVKKGGSNNNNNNNNNRGDYNNTGRSKGDDEYVNNYDGEGGGGGAAAGGQDKGLIGREKPRRLEDDVAEYLLRIDPSLISKGGSGSKGKSNFRKADKSSNENEDDEDEDNDAGGGNMMVSNVLEEVSNRIASAACDRRTMVIIELLCANATLTQLIAIVGNFAPYSLFLTRNRYSSHVLQVVISRFCYLIKSSNNIGDLTEQKISASLLSLVEPIFTNMEWLFRDMNASHVVRAAICLLVGLPVVSEKKGKGSKHQHSVSMTEPLHSLIDKDTFCIDEKKCFPIPHEFHNKVKAWVGEFLSKTPKATLHQFIADVNSSAVITLIIRIFSNDTIITGGREMVNNFMSKVLELEGEDGDVVDNSVADNNDSSSSSSKSSSGKSGIFYEMSGDKSASYFLESVIECGDVDTLTAIIEKNLVDDSADAEKEGRDKEAQGGCAGSSSGSGNTDSLRIKSYITDNCANFVIQAIFRKMVSLFNSVSQSGSVIKSKLLKKLKSFAKYFLLVVLDSDFFKYVFRSKGGVILWIIELARALDLVLAHAGKDDVGSKQSSDLKHSSRVGTKILDVWMEDCGVDRAVVGKSEVKTAILRLLTEKLSQLQKAAPTPASASGGGAEAARSAEDAANDASKADNAQLLFARLVGAVLKLKYKESVSSMVSDSISRLPSATISYLCCSQTLSRTVMDSFIDSNEGNDIIFGQFLDSISPCVIPIATNFTGHHIIRRLFDKSEINMKERISSLLCSSAVMPAISANREGKTLLRIFSLAEFQRDRDAWKQWVRRKERAGDILSFMTAENNNTGNGDSTPKNAGKSSSKDASDVSKIKSSGSSSSNIMDVTAAVDEDGEDDEDDGSSPAAGGAQNKAKRKRKRKKPSAAGGGGAGGIADDAEGLPQAKTVKAI